MGETNSMSSELRLAVLGLSVISVLVTPAFGAASFDHEKTPHGDQREHAVIDKWSTTAN